MGTFLIGADISHWNNVNEINPAFLDFVWMKATEGTKWRDPDIEKNMAKIGAVMDVKTPPFIGYYHFCTADNRTDPKIEAENFIRVVKDVNPCLNCMLALDIESNHIRRADIETWAQKFCNVVEKETGKNTFIYCSASETFRFPNLSSKRPLWVAHYHAKKPEIKSWKKETFWQFTNAPIDFNIFHGTREDLSRICLQGAKI